MNLKEPVKQEQVFYCKDGTILRDLEGLATKLMTIPQDVYAHHVTNERNDFHNWIRDVYGDAALAQKIARATNSQEAAALLEQALHPPLRLLRLLEEGGRQKQLLLTTTRATAQLTNRVVRDKKATQQKKRRSGGQEKARKRGSMTSLASPFISQDRQPLSGKKKRSPARSALATLQTKISKPRRSLKRSLSTKKVALKRKISARKTAQSTKKQKEQRTAKTAAAPPSQAQKSNKKDASKKKKESGRIDEKFWETLWNTLKEKKHLKEEKTSEQPA